uniref:Uncharacterized protein n=1 Tax=Arundo donax TaxID=35708 RepID=A0A0A9CT69_ARUDO
MISHVRITSYSFETNYIHYCDVYEGIYHVARPHHVLVCNL